ncbi:MAG: DeoR family transcriptional regulator [Methanothrix sp.]
MSESIIVKDEDLLELKKPIIEACIKSARKNGWSDAMGVLWGTLFLESEPLSLDTLAEKTGYSKTTVRSNMNYLESFGIARRVVGPLGKQHRNKQHRYELVTDIEALRPAILSNKKEEARLILEALLQIRKSLDGRETKDSQLEVSLAKSMAVYEETGRILDLIAGFSSQELIEILESKRR